MARGKKGRSKLKLNQSRAAWRPTLGNTAARNVVGKFKSN